VDLLTQPVASSRASLIRPAQNVGEQSSARIAVMEVEQSVLSTMNGFQQAGDFVGERVKDRTEPPPQRVRQLGGVRLESWWTFQRGQANTTSEPRASATGWCRVDPSLTLRALISRRFGRR
jgi:hypothetical protein